MHLLLLLFSIGAGCNHLVFALLIRLRLRRRRWCVCAAAARCFGRLLFLLGTLLLLQLKILALNKRYQRITPSLQLQRGARFNKPIKAKLGWGSVSRKEHDIRHIYPRIRRIRLTLWPHAAPRRRSPCQSPACAACRPKTDPQFLCSFCPCCCHTAIAADGTAHDNETSAKDTNNYLNK